MKYSQTAINYYLRKYYFNYYFVKHFNWRVKSKKFSDYVQRYKKLHKNDNRVQKFWTRRRKGRNIHNLLSDTVIVESLQISLICYWKQENTSCIFRVCCPEGNRYVNVLVLSTGTSASKSKCYLNKNFVLNEVSLAPRQPKCLKFPFVAKLN